MATEKRWTWGMDIGHGHRNCPRIYLLKQNVGFVLKNSLKRKETKKKRRKKISEMKKRWFHWEKKF